MGAHLHLLPGILIAFGLIEGKIARLLADEHGTVMDGLSLIDIDCTAFRAWQHCHIHL
ncbi:MAG: hypothetical protein AB8B64_08580 [Granulosicoccus sp.]